MRAKGLEPPRLAAPDPKSGLATNYNTPATILNKNNSEEQPTNYICIACPCNWECKVIKKYLPSKSNTTKNL